MDAFFFLLGSKINYSSRFILFNVFSWLFDHFKRIFVSKITIIVLIFSTRTIMKNTTEMQIYKLIKSFIWVTYLLICIFRSRNWNYSTNNMYLNTTVDIFQEMEFNIKNKARKNVFIQLCKFVLGFLDWSSIWNPLFSPFFHLYVPVILNQQFKCCQ